MLKVWHLGQVQGQTKFAYLNEAQTPVLEPPLSSSSHRGHFYRCEFSQYETLHFLLFLCIASTVLFAIPDVILMLFYRYWLRFWISFLSWKTRSAYYISGFFHVD